MRGRKNGTFSRRDVLKLAGLGLGSLFAARSALAEYRFLAPVSVANPLAAYPNPMMGGPGDRVHIMQGRAAFQRDIEEGHEPRIADLYPNVHVDVYPDEVLRATDASAYTGAVGLDNPISRPKHSAVLDQMAEGFGTLTVEPDQQSDGFGVWKDRKWRVIITHPMAPGDPNDPMLAPGSETLAAFAVWEGDAREVGARKAWSNWVPLKLDLTSP